MINSYKRTYYKDDYKDVYHNIYNASFYYGDYAINVLVNSFSYSWTLSQSGQSQTRKFKVLYPQFFRQTNPKMELQFPNVESMQEFVDWVAEWQNYVTDQTGAFDPLHFVGDSAMGISLDYLCLINDVNYANKFDNNAPKLTVSLILIEDEWTSSSKESKTIVTGKEVVDISDESTLQVAEEMFY